MSNNRNGFVALCMLMVLVLGGLLAGCSGPSTPEPSKEAVKQRNDNEK